MSRMHAPPCAKPMRLHASQCMCQAHAPAPPCMRLVLNVDVKGHAHQTDAPCLQVQVAASGWADVRAIRHVCRDDQGVWLLHARDRLCRRPAPRPHEGSPGRPCDEGVVPRCALTCSCVCAGVCVCVCAGVCVCVRTGLICLRVYVCITAGMTPSAMWAKMLVNVNASAPFLQVHGHSAFSGRSKDAMKQVRRAHVHTHARTRHSRTHISTLAPSPPPLHRSGEAGTSGTASGGTPVGGGGGAVEPVALQQRASRPR